jgi:hypothetical protein
MNIEFALIVIFQNLNKFRKINPNSSSMFFRCRHFWDLIKREFSLFVGLFSYFQSFFRLFSEISLKKKIGSDSSQKMPKIKKILANIHLFFGEYQENLKK